MNRGILFLIILCVAVYPMVGFSQVKADSYIVTNASGEVLANKDENKLRPVASLTKVATALVILAKLEKETAIDPETELISVPPEALVGGANPLKLEAGDRLSVAAALHAAILGSDNVSAYSLAARFGGVGDFVHDMNELAASLDMDSTKFINPHGLDYADRQGKSTAADMARLGVAAIRSETLMSIAAKPKAIVKIERRGRTIEKLVSNTNHILGKGGIDGLKTGTTRRAGACFLATARSSEGRLVCVVLDSPDRFGDTRKLLEIGWDSL